MDFCHDNAYYYPMNYKPQGPSLGVITRCQICGSQNLYLVLDLGHQPPPHSLLTREGLGQEETTYPLRMCRCRDCGLLQLDYAVDPKIVFAPTYPYQTGMTNMLVQNFRSLAGFLCQRYALGRDDMVIDLGSNDGTLLQGFKESGVKVLGVEPTNVAKIAEKNGIPTIQEYFTEATAQKIMSSHGKAKIIAAANMFAHVNNLFEFLSGVYSLLSDDGVFVSESQYLMDIIKKMEFDTIYHEHLRFYSVKPLIKLFSETGFSVVDAERIDAAGGSIRVYAAKGSHLPSDRVGSLIKEEESFGLYDEKVFDDFALAARKEKVGLTEIVAGLKKDGKKIVGIGAPARASTILGFTHLDRDFIDYLGEKKGSLKIGLFMPATHVPIVDEEIIFKEQPEYAIVLSWHIGAELMKKMRELGYKGKFILPLPEPLVVNSD